MPIGVVPTVAIAGEGGKITSGYPFPEMIQDQSPGGTDDGISVGCDSCTVAHLSDAKFNWHEHKTTGEQFGYLSLLAKNRGWSAVNDNGVGKFVCPSCLAKQNDAEEMILPVFEEECECPKCGNSKIETVYCEGKKATCSLGAIRPHMHRQCLKCSYAWITRCKCDNPPKRWWKCIF